MRNKDILIHLHMPKSGGTTLKNIIKNNYPPKAYFDVYQDEKQREHTLEALCKEDVLCIQGHFPFGVHKYFSTPSTYITLLRNPIQRVISEYFFIKNNPRHNLYQLVNNTSLEDYQQQEQNKNLQTRLLSGQIGCPLTDLDLEQAKVNMQAYFSVVGITEMFNESLYLMKEKFNWKNIQYTKQNITKKKPTIEQLPASTIQSIKTNNHFDIKLYQFAKQLLIQDIHHLPSKSKKELYSFRQNPSSSRQNKRNGYL